MASAFLATTPNPPLAGFIGIAMLNNGGPPFDCRRNLQGQTLPILDIYGTAGQAGDARYAQERRTLISPSYTQVAIVGADHAFSDHEEELLTAVQGWIMDSGQLTTPKRCKP